MLLCWLAMAGVDFILHGGLLAGFYAEETPFLLPLAAAFGRIPVGYAGLFLSAILLVWIQPRVKISGWVMATWFGLRLGVLVGGSFLLGLISISTISLPLAVVWLLGQSLQFGVGAIVIHQASEANSFEGSLPASLSSFWLPF